MGPDDRAVERNEFGLEETVIFEPSCCGRQRGEPSSAAAAPTSTSTKMAPRKRTRRFQWPANSAHFDKIFILLFSSCLLLAGHFHSSANFLRPVEAGSKSKEKSSKTTVIAISGGQGPAKAHPVPIPWPVVHCHHHHHHLKYVPKPVLVHHWVKKFKPIEIEASNEHYQLLENSQGAHHQFQNHEHEHEHHEHHQPAANFMASQPQATRLQVPPSPPAGLAGDLFAATAAAAAAGQPQAGPMSVFSQSDQSKLPYDLMDGSQLVSALSNAFDPLLAPASSTQPSGASSSSDSRILTAPQVTMLFPGDFQRALPSPRPLYGPEQQQPQQLPSYSLVGNQTHKLHEIDKEFNKFKQQQQQQKRFRTNFPARSANTTSGPQFSNQQLEKLSKTIISVQKQQQQQQQQQSFKSPVTFDTEPVDSLKSNVVAADLQQQPASAPAVIPVSQPPRKADYQSLGHEALAGNKPSHPFDEAHDQLRDEASFGGRLLAQPALVMDLNGANLREESETRRALEQVSRHQAHRLASLNLFNSNSNNIAHFDAAQLHRMAPLAPRVQAQMSRARQAAPARPLLSHRNQVLAVNPAAVSARMATALSESRTINMMTRLAERMAQLEVKSQLDKQLAKIAPSAAKKQPEQTRGPVLGAVEQFWSLLSPLKSSRERRRQSGGKKLTQQWNAANNNNNNLVAARNQRQATTQAAVSLVPQASVNRLVWTAPSNQKPPHLGEHVITASPLNLNLVLNQTARANPAASSKFMAERSATIEQMAKLQQQPQTERLASESSNLVNKIAEPKPGPSTIASGQSRTTATKTAQQQQQQPQQQQVMSAEHESRFYRGQHEHLEKTRQQELKGAGQASQLSLELHDPHHQSAQTNEAKLAPSRSARQQLQQPKQMDQAKRANVPALTAANAIRLYSSQSSNVRQSVMPASQPQESQAGEAHRASEHGADERPAQLEAAAKMKADQQSMFGQPPAPPQLAGPEQLPSYLEFPMSPQQWSSEAVKSINAQEQQQQQQSDPQSQQSAEQSEQAGLNRDEQQQQQQPASSEENGEEEKPAKENDEQQQEADENHEPARPQSGNELVSYEFVQPPAQHASGATLPSYGQAQANNPMHLGHSLAMDTSAPILQQASWGQPHARPTNPYGYYTAGSQQEAGQGSSLAALDSFPWSHLVNQGDQSQFSKNYNPMTQQAYFSSSASQLEELPSFAADFGQTSPELSGAKLAAGLRAPMLNPSASLVSSSLASPTNDIAQLRQFQSSLGQAVASQANNLTGLSALTGSLRNQMQARFPPQLPQMPNIPQPPQLPNLPMPPPGMMQMAASMALPLAMARMTRNNNRFRNQQVNAAASGGGAAITPAQRLLRGASNLTNRLMRSRRRPATPSSRPLGGGGGGNTRRRQPFVFGRPNGSGSLGSSGINIRRRRPMVRFFQTVVDMSRRPHVATAANLAASASSSVLSAAKASAVATVASGAPSSSGSLASGASGSVANAAASAVVQAAAAIAADKLKPKVDAQEAAVRREGHASRLSRSLEKLQLDMRRVNKQQQQQQQQNSAGGLRGAIVMPGLPPVAMTDGSLATFGSMTSPVDLLNRQLAQRKARELATRHFSLAHADENPLAMLQVYPQFELMRLNSIAHAAAPLESRDVGREPSQSQMMGSSNYELIAANGPSSQPRIERLSAGASQAPQAQPVNMTHVPLVANHFNLLMFTSQNVTGNLGLKLAQPQASQEAAGEKASEKVAEQPTILPDQQQLKSSVGEHSARQDEQLVGAFLQQQQQQPGNDQANRAPSSELDRQSKEVERDDGNEEAGRRFEENRAQSAQQSAANSARVERPKEGEEERRLFESSSFEIHKPPFLFGPKEGESTTVAAKVEAIASNQVSEQTMSPATKAPRKRKKTHASKSSGSQQPPQQVSLATVPFTTSTSAPTSSPSTSYRPPPPTPPPTTTTERWLAGKSDGGAVDVAAQLDQYVASDSHFGAEFQPQTGGFGANKMEQLKIRRPSTSARPTRAARLGPGESPSQNDVESVQAAAGSSARAKVVEGELPGTTRAPSQLAGGAQPAAEQTERSKSADSAQATGDYVRAIKLVRGLAYPWPPPTQSSKPMGASH